MIMCTAGDLQGLKHLKRCPIVFVSHKFMAVSGADIAEDPLTEASQDICHYCFCQSQVHGSVSCTCDVSLYVLLEIL